MVISRLGPLSFAKVSGIIHAILGLVAGGMFALVSQVSRSHQSEGAFIDVIFGVGALVVMPIAYGVLGFVLSLIMAGLYNLVVRFVGGIEIQTNGER